MDKDSVETRLKGKVNQAVGATREKLGHVTGKEEMELKGREQHLKGDFQENLGKAQAAANSAEDKAKDAAEDLAHKMKDAAGR